MKIAYLGTGAAEGIPALFCRCEYCRGVRLRGGREVRTRAQTVIDGELSIDFPPDVFSHGLHADLSAIHYLLVTHSHMDHFYAHDFILRGYKYAYGLTSPTLDVFANAECLEVYGESTKREMKEEVAQKISLHKLVPFEPVSFGAYTVHPLRAAHSSAEPLLFLIEKGEKRVLHLSDTGTLPEDSFRYLKELGRPLGLVTLDCTFLWGETAEHARHMGLDENVRVRNRLLAAGLAGGDTKFVITHFSHNSRPTEESLARAEREYGFLAAYDGMTLEI